MSKILKELVKQAEVYALDKANAMDDDVFEYSFDDDFQEKLAELIVNKCADAIQQDTRINWLYAVQISRELRDILRD